MPSAFHLILTTVPSRSKARQISQHLLKKKLAACVNILEGVESFFWWEGKIGRTKECLLFIKTRASYFSRVQRFLKQNHPYEVPEIIAFSIEKGNAAYLDWMRAVTARTNI